MAHATILDPDTLKGIAEHVSTFRSSEFLSSTDPSASLELGEAFEVWTLKATFTDDIAASATTADDVHFQLLSKDTPIGYVRAHRDISGAWEVTEVFESPLAGSIAAAISEADSQVPDDAQTRLLVVPTYQVWALWFTEPIKSIFVISCPTSFTNLKSGQLMQAPAFLQALRREKPLLGVRKHQ